MQISEHYLPYTKKTLIAVTNNELAKLYKAEDREVEPVETLQIDMEAGDDRASGTSNSAPPKIDNMKLETKKDLYRMLSDQLMKAIKEGYEDIILCAPEVNKNEITEAMHTDVMKLVVEVIPKNLASLPEDQIVRILQESRGLS